MLENLDIEAEIKKLSFENFDKQLVIRSDEAIHFCRLAKLQGILFQLNLEYIATKDASILRAIKSVNIELCSLLGIKVKPVYNFGIAPRLKDSIPDDSLKAPEAIKKFIMALPVKAFTVRDVKLEFKDKFKSATISQAIGNMKKDGVIESDGKRGGYIIK